MTTGRLALMTVVQQCRMEQRTYWQRPTLVLTNSLVIKGHQTNPQLSKWLTCIYRDAAQMQGHLHREKHNIILWTDRILLITSLSNIHAHCKAPQYSPHPDWQAHRPNAAAVFFLHSGNCFLQAALYSTLQPIFRWLSSCIGALVHKYLPVISTDYS